MTIFLIQLVIAVVDLIKALVEKLDPIRDHAVKMKERAIARKVKHHKSRVMV